MDRLLILPLASCTDGSLVGGKAAGLARLLAGGFCVPPGFCVTTVAYEGVLRATGFSPTARWSEALHTSGAERQRILSLSRTAIQNADITKLTAPILEQVRRLDSSLQRLWAVRSSATNEDGASASFAGLYLTRLGIPPEEIGLAVKDLWLSMWDERVLNYHAMSGLSDVPAMAVLLQPMLEAQAAGVAYSNHPITGRTTQVVIDAVAGLAAALVEGRTTPDQYVVEIDEKGQPMLICDRRIVGQTSALRMTGQGLRDVSLPAGAVGRAILSDDQLFDLARTAKRIEQTFGHPVDLEWLCDHRGLWLLQARPISGRTRVPRLTNDDCEWSRANFKETLPDLPSPLALSFLERFMERYILTPYRRLGCRIPEGVSSVRIFQGRPYINMTLFHMLIGQLRGDPFLLMEQMGGDSLTRVPEVRPLGWMAFARAGFVMMVKMRQAVRHGPACFAEMKAIADKYRAERLSLVSSEYLVSRLDEIERWLDRHELTFAIVGGVSQCLQTLDSLLPHWLGKDWRALLNGALQGQSTVISAQQIVRLAELADRARHDPFVLSLFTAEEWDARQTRCRLEGTAFLRSFNCYLDDYGHRGVGESDVQSPRFSDRPELLLAVLRTQILSPTGVAPADIFQRQTMIRESTLVEIRTRFGWRLHRRAVFSWLYRRLCQFFALREANRHHLMYYSAAVRSLLLRLGERLVEQGLLSTREDIFYLTHNELVGKSRDWRGLIQARLADRDRYAVVNVSDTVRDWRDTARGLAACSSVVSEGTLHGIPISGGLVEGPVRIIRSMEDWGRVRQGDILVVSVIDPGLAPLFGVAAGLVAEMGGTLSHGAIIAREYGLPAIANVPALTARIQEGDRISLDGERGEIIIRRP